MSERSRAAYALRGKGCTYREIGEILGVGCGRARQLVLREERERKRLEEVPKYDPLEHFIVTRASRNLSTRTLSRLLRLEYDGDMTALAKRGPADLLKINGMGPQSVRLIAEGLEYHGVIANKEDWLRSAEARMRKGSVCPKCGYKEE